MKNKLHFAFMAVVFVVVVLCAVLIIISLNESNEESNGYNPIVQTKWPNNDLTKGVPKFEGDIYSVMVSGTSTVVYAQNVEKSALDAYAAKLAASGLQFGNGDYPKTAQKGDVFITLAYNAEEKKLSITFALKNESESWRQFGVSEISEVE
ncbi:MAG TPA: hypothetical protein PKV51_00335 [Bacillota bacterium]|nr:hypothetical protein [Bacillota bacterium]HPP84341.1 hypothetical protein [Bacillota bacterium]